MEQFMYDIVQVPGMPSTGLFLNCDRNLMNE